ncbi:SDR family NAD(P)-dependent oxidoreductase [Porphyromonas sp.]
MNEAKTALITGASSGLGEAYARLHASYGGNLILVARRRERLLSLKEELEQKYPISVWILVKDLAEIGASASLFAEVQQLGVCVDYLINNAGLGGQGSLAERSQADDANLLSVDIRALTELTKLFLPGFIERGRGRILNVSSIASLVPGPWQATYFASKAYVTSLTLALSEELRGTGVTATVVLPGGMRTGFEAAARLEGTGLATQLTHSADDVARHSYEAMLRGRSRVIAGTSLLQRLLLFFVPFVPISVVLKVVARLHTR